MTRPPAALSRLAFCILLTAPPAFAGRDVPDFAALVRAHGAEVVNVSTTLAKRERAAEWSDASPDDAPDAPRSPDGADATSLGSGLIVSRNGYLLTCAHIVEGA